MLLIAFALAQEPVASEPSSASSPAPAAPLINVEFDHTDIHAALRFLADAGDVDIVIGDDVKGTVTLQLRKVTWDEAFQATLMPGGLIAVPVEGAPAARSGAGRSQNAFGSTWEVHAR